MTSHALASLTATYTDSDDEKSAEDNQTSVDNEDKQVASIPYPSLPASPNKQLVSYVETIVSDEESSSPPAEYQEYQDDMRVLAMDTDDELDDDDDVEIPPEPPGKCPKELQDHIAKLYYRMKHEGLDMNKFIQDKKNFRNPSIYDKLIQFCDINELDTNFPPEIYDPLRWGQESYYDELAKAQKAEMDRRGKEMKENKKNLTKTIEMRIAKIKAARNIINSLNAKLKLPDNQIMI